MLRSWKVIRLTKYVFLTLLITAASFMIADLFVRRPVSIIAGQATDELAYKPKLNLSFESVLPMLDENFSQCLTNPGKGFCLMTAKKKLELLHKEGHPVLPYLMEIDKHLIKLHQQLRG
ncbi:uncharacterized protein LOC118205381 [Stegodyphus dumicola]|uniref:uncharacterized protein LOC118205381 n=1 Tax=Stegodyphus dumicola TaxID=202533 RepID=UPI0015AA9387|nr:uncharacterized protein LOC118205381 [Stegodyphus dumicola]